MHSGYVLIPRAQAASRGVKRRRGSRAQRPSPSPRDIYLRRVRDAARMAGGILRPPQTRRQDSCPPPGRASAAVGRNVQYLLAAKFHSVTHGTAASEAMRTLRAFGFPPMWRSWPVKRMRKSLVRPRFSMRPTRLVATNMAYWVRRLPCLRARNVQRRFQTNPLVTARQKDMLALIHHGVLGVTESSSQRVPLSMRVLLAPTKQNLTSWRVPVRRSSALASAIITVGLHSGRPYAPGPHVAHHEHEVRDGCKV